MTLHRLLTGLLLVALVAVPIGSAVTSPATTAPDEAVRLFISDDRDPVPGTLPPFIFTGITDLARAENISVANLSRMRDIAYGTTQPPYRVGEAERTLGEYRRAQVRAIERNESTTLWLPDSQLSNGTVVTNAHITLLGTASGVRTQLGMEETNGSDRWLIPRNGNGLDLSRLFDAHAEPHVFRHQRDEDVSQLHARQSECQPDHSDRHTDVGG